jgi:hypothetical protein
MQIQTAEWPGSKVEVGKISPETGAAGGRDVRNRESIPGEGTGGIAVLWKIGQYHFCGDILR